MITYININEYVCMYVNTYVYGFLCLHTSVLQCMASRDKCTWFLCPQ